MPVPSLGEAANSSVLALHRGSGARNSDSVTVKNSDSGFTVGVTSLNGLIRQAQTERSVGTTPFITGTARGVHVSPTVTNKPGHANADALAASAAYRLAPNHRINGGLTSVLSIDNSRDVNSHKPGTVGRNSGTNGFNRARGGDLSLGRGGGNRGSSQSHAVLKDVAPHHVIFNFTRSRADVEVNQAASVVQGTILGANGGSMVVYHDPATSPGLLAASTISPNIAPRIGTRLIPTPDTSSLFLLGLALLGFGVALRPLRRGSA